MADPGPLQPIVNSLDAINAILRDSLAPSTWKIAFTFLPSVLAALLGFVGGVLTILFSECVRVRKAAHRMRRAALAELRQVEPQLVYMIILFGGVPAERREREVEWYSERFPLQTDLAAKPIPNSIGPIPLPIVDSVFGSTVPGFTDAEIESLVDFRRRVDFLNLNAQDIKQLLDLTYTVSLPNHAVITENLEVMKNGYRDRLVPALDSLRHALSLFAQSARAGGPWPWLRTVSHR